MARDGISLDWAVDMARGREIVGPERLIQGNVDPTILFGDEAQVTPRHARGDAAATCLI